MKKALSIPLQEYANSIKEISNAIVKAQKPIKILNAIKWPSYVSKTLLDSKFTSMPSLKAADYDQIRIGFHPELKIRTFKDIIEQIKVKLGKKDRLGKLLITTCQNYIDACHLLQARGTKNFGKISKKLYGSSNDTFMDDQCTVKDLGNLLTDILSLIEIEYFEHDTDKKIYSASQASKVLNKRFDPYFHKHSVYCSPSQNIIADAAAGSKKVLLNQDTSFSPRDIDLLEVHEGWIHIGTSLNGAKQKYAKWLSKGPPRVTATQEGLAVMMEIFSFRTTPLRMKKINDRLFGITLVENGANIIDLAQHYKNKGYSDNDTLYNLRRIFRGTSLEADYPFTKDLSYSIGFIENYNFLRACMANGHPFLIPFLFSGKIHVNDIPLIYELYQDGIINFPYYIPTLFSDLNGLAVWMSFSNFFNNLNLTKIIKNYETKFSTFKFKEEQKRKKSLK